MLRIFLTLLLFKLSFVGFSQGTWEWLHTPSNTIIPNFAAPMGTEDINNVPAASYTPSHWAVDSNLYYMNRGGQSPSLSPALWKFNLNTMQWTWVQGPQNGTLTSFFGTKGVPDSSVYPQSQELGSHNWVDLNGNLWLYGDDNYDNPNMWKFDRQTGMWCWKNGPGNINPVNPVFGTMGVPDSTSNPGRAGMESRAAWTDDNGDLWMYCQTSATTWRYDVATDLWSYEHGTPGSGTFFTQLDEYDIQNNPGMGMFTFPAWKSDSGTFIMMKHNNSAARRLWEFDPQIKQWRCLMDRNSWNSTTNLVSCEVDSNNVMSLDKIENRMAWKDNCNRIWTIAPGGGFINYAEFWIFDLYDYNFEFIYTWNTRSFDGSSPLNPTNQISNQLTGTAFWQVGPSFYIYEKSYATMWQYHPDSVWANFSFSPKETPCFTFDFTNSSTSGCNKIKSFHWNFDDPSSGSNNTSDQENPSHQFSGPGTYLVELIVENCTWQSDTISQLVIVPECSNSLDEHSLFQLDIYPNPTNSTVNIGKSGDFKVFDITGRMILSDHTSNGVINVSHLIEGQYFIWIDGATGSFQKQ